jgi:hypothetical protein
MWTQRRDFIEKYLRTSFEGRDRECVDSEIVERGLLDEPHRRTQWRLSGLFWGLRKAADGRPELMKTFEE